jgi:hypothetical protein
LSAIVAENGVRAMRNLGQNHHRGDEVSGDRGLIEVHLRNVGQLFDTLDPSRFHDKDLDPKADEFIVDSARELSSRRPREIVLYVDQAPNDPDTQRIVSDAIRRHFARRSELSRRELRQLLRRGVISLAIGLAFLVALFFIAQATALLTAEEGLASVVRESMLIVGWVAMWRPIETFLYDWWPIVGERRLYDRLGRMRVRIVSDRAVEGQADVAEKVVPKH